MEMNGMNRKICLITGSTSGIGYVTARVLAEAGSTTIIVGRDAKKCERSVRRIKRETGNSSVAFLQADLSSQQDIRQLSDSFHDRYDHLDVLVNNAGAKFVSRHVTVDGLEMTFALNHLAYFLLTNLLFDRLKAADKARVINVSSGAHFGGGIDFDHLQSENDYVGKRAYAQSKLANILFTYELSRRLKGSKVTANALNPGGVITNFCRNNGWVSWLKHVTAHVLARNLIGPEEGAKTSLFLASSPEVEGVSGKYFFKEEEVRSSDSSYNTETAKRLWDVCMTLTGLSASPL